MERLEELARKLRANEFDAVVCENRAQALDAVLALCGGKVVGVGDSATADAIGLNEAIPSERLHSIKLSMNDGTRIASLTADVFISSVNAIAADTGELVNIDGRGNRVAATIYGPKELIIVAGRNKLADDLPSAIHRARNTAAVRNVQAKQYPNPCGKAGRCVDCRSPRRICRVTAIMHRKPFGFAKATVVLINEDLGF